LNISYVELGLGVGIGVAIWAFIYSGFLKAVLNAIGTVFAFIAETVVPKKSMSSHAADMILTYLKASCNRSIIGGSERFIADPVWIKSLKARYHVIFRTLSEGDRVFFYKGWIPVVVARSRQEENNTTDPALRYLRGMLDIDTLMAEAAIHYNQITSKQNKPTRFCVWRFYGSSKERSEQTELRLKQDSLDDDESLGREPLGWKESDIGAPPLTNKEADSLYIHPDLAGFIRDIDFWSANESWYTDRAVPWRRGYLLHGLPGTGKTSIVRAVGESLGLPICIPDLTSMDNEDLTSTWSKIVATRSPCIILIEDIDAVFNLRKSLVNGLTYDALLNCIDGVEKTNGIVVVITTNHIDNVDPALAAANASRPGRIDKVFKMPDSLNRDGRLKIASRIIQDPQIVDALLNRVQGTEMTPAQFQEVCIQEALGLLWENR
jgi:hypothetical protein